MAPNIARRDICGPRRPPRPGGGSGVSRRSGRGNPARNTAECHRVAVSPGGRTERHVLTLARPEKRVRQQKFNPTGFAPTNLTGPERDDDRLRLDRPSCENSARLHGCRGRPRTESDRAGLRTCSGGRPDVARVWPSTAEGPFLGARVLSFLTGSSWPISCDLDDRGSSRSRSCAVSNTTQAKN